MRYQYFFRTSLITVLIFLIYLSKPYAQPSERIEIPEGQSSVIKVDFTIEDVFSSNETICRPARQSQNQVLLQALSPGETDITILGSDEKKKVILITVTPDAVLKEIKEILGDIEGIRFKSAGSRIVVEGEVFNKNSLEKINRVLAGMPNVLNLVELSPLVQKIMQKEIEKALSEGGLGGVRVSVGKNKYVLMGTVVGEDASKRAETIALAFTPDIMNAIKVQEVRPSVPPPPPKEKIVLIEMTLNIMEIERNVLRDIGVHWNPGGSLSAGGSYSSSSQNKPTLAGSITGTLSNLFPKMRKLQEDGKGRTLMQQTIITKSGGQADFFAGAEIPIPVAQEGGTMSVEYKKVGVTLNFSPLLDGHDIYTPVKIESSRVTGEGPGGAPLIATNQLNTMVSVKDGDSIALGGLIGQRELDTISNSPPGDGLSLFQRNKGNRQARETSEVVIFVTPRTISKNTDAVKDMNEKVKSSFKEQELDYMREQLKNRKKNQ